MDLPALCGDLMREPRYQILESFLLHPKLGDALDVHSQFGLSPESH